MKTHPPNEDTSADLTGPALIKLAVGKIQLTIGIINRNGTPGRSRGAPIEDIAGKLNMIF
jgi:hypothetical protein